MPTIHECVTGQQSPEKPLNPSVAGVLSANWSALLQRAREGAAEMQQVAQNAPQVAPSKAEVTAEQERLSEALVNAQQRQQQRQQQPQSRAGRSAQRYVPQPKKSKHNEPEMEF